MVSFHLPLSPSYINLFLASYIQAKSTNFTKEAKAITVKSVKSTKVFVSTGSSPIIMYYNNPVTMESQGQCHDYIVELGICERKQCAAECTAKWKGSGRCIEDTNNCLCTFKCKT
ncbi:hypothetical protein Bca101_035222 [Brassica carinata]